MSFIQEGKWKERQMEWMCAVPFQRIQITKEIPPRAASNHIRTARYSLIIKLGHSTPSKLRIITISKDNLAK